MSTECSHLVDSTGGLVGSSERTDCGGFGGQESSRGWGVAQRMERGGGRLCSWYTALYHSLQRGEWDGNDTHAIHMHIFTVYNVCIQALLYTTLQRANNLQLYFTLSMHGWTPIMMPLPYTFPFLLRACMEVPSSGIHLYTRCTCIQERVAHKYWAYCYDFACTRCWVLFHHMCCCDCLREPCTQIGS